MNRPHICSDAVDGCAIKAIVTLPHQGFARDLQQNALIPWLGHVSTLSGNSAGAVGHSFSAPTAGKALNRFSGLANRGGSIIQAASGAQPLEAAATSAAKSSASFSIPSPNWKRAKSTTLIGAPASLPAASRAASTLFSPSTTKTCSSRQTSS